MGIEVSREESFAMSNHHPLVAGRLRDGRPSYIYELDEEDRLVYYGSGPTPEEARFLRRRLDGNLLLDSPSPSGALFARVLRYDPDVCMRCNSYADKWGVDNGGMDSTGPFSWNLHRYLPAFYRPHASVS